MTDEIPCFCGHTVEQHAGESCEKMFCHCTGFEARRTVTLTSHPGARGRFGFGPQEFDDLSGRPFLVQIGEQRLLEHLGMLLTGWPIERMLGDMEVTADGSILFDGDRPWQDGCYPEQLYFADGYVYRQHRDGSLPMLTELARDYRQPRRFGISWFSFVELDKMTERFAVVKDGTVNGSLGRFGDERVRKAWSLFEIDQVADWGDVPEVVFGDRERAEELFDPVRRIEAEITKTREQMSRDLRQLQSLVSQMQDLSDGGLPDELMFLPKIGSTYSTSSRTSAFKAPTDSADRLVVLLALRRLFD